MDDGNLSDQMEHLYNLYRCADCSKDHTSMYEYVLCGLDQKITDFTIEVDDLEDKLRWLT